MVNTENELVYVTEKPNIPALAEEFKRCTPLAYGWDRVRDNEDTRFCRWNGQSTDGKKHNLQNTPAFPWDGASDTRVNLVDSIISEHVALQKGAFRRSIALLKGTEPKDEETAANVNQLLKWLTDEKMNDELQRNFERSAQWQGTYGNFILHPTWEREVELRRDQITLEKMVEIAGQTPGSPLQMLTQLIANEDTEDQAVALVQEYGVQIARAAAKEQLVNATSDLFDNYKIKDKTARRFVRELREGKVSSLPIPYICKNQPCIKALKLWESVFIPSYVTDLQKAPRIFVRVYYTEQELRGMAELEGWDQEWVEKAVEQKGRQSTWTASTSMPTQTIFVNAESSWTWTDAENNSDEIEVIWAYTRELDDDNVPSIYVTIFHPEITGTTDDPVYAKREPLTYAHKKMPFIAGPREHWHESILSSRGIPEVLSSRQREIKVQRDSLVDWTSLSVAPPILIPSTAPNSTFKYGPNAQNLVMPGREPRQMELHSPGATMAFELMERFEREVKEEMGLPHPEIPTARTQVKQQQIVDNIFAPWTEAFQQTVVLIHQYMPDSEWMEITGSPKPKTMDFEKDFILSFDVREMDDEHVLKRYKAVTEIMQLDRDGVISSSKLVMNMLRAVNPQLAKEVTMDAQQASEQLVKRVNDDFVSMFAGNEPRLAPDENPTAQAELNIAQQIMQMNRKYQQAMQQDPDFQEKVKKWSQNRIFNISQKQNATTGRYGVAA